MAPGVDMRAPAIAGGLVLAIAATAAVGWALGIDPLTSVVPGWATLKPNTALCFALLGAALVATPRWRAPLAAFPALLASLSGIEWAIDVDLGIDELLARDPASLAAGQPPGRMAAATAIGILLGALSIAGAFAFPRGSQTAAAGVLCVAWVALLGFAYELGPLSRVWLYGTVSLPTATALVAVGVGSLALNPHAGWMRAITGDDGGARLLRRLGPAAVLLPSVTGWLALHAERVFDLQRGFAVAAGATLDALVYAGLLASTAAVTRREERARTAAEDLVRRREGRLAELTRDLMSAHEDERRRLAHELHDELGQTLTALGLLVERAPRSPAAAAESSDLLRSLTENVRRMSLDLRPSVLDDLGLAPAVRWLAARFPTAPIAVTTHGDGRRYREDVEIAAFRIVQEALTNAVRHAGASRIAVELHLSAVVDLTVSDDGRGFEPDRSRPGSIGLDGMRQRATTTGGTLEVSSAPGRTVVHVILPGPDRHDGG